MSINKRAVPRPTESHSYEPHWVQEFYSELGQIAAGSEHLNLNIRATCIELLRERGLPNEYGNIVLAGNNLESIRRVWVSLFKFEFGQSPEMNGLIDKFATRIDNITRRRNDAIHSYWVISHNPFEETVGVKIARDISSKGSGGVRATKKPDDDFSEIIDELNRLEATMDAIRKAIRDKADVAAALQTSAVIYGQPKKKGT